MSEEVCPTDGVRTVLRAPPGAVADDPMVGRVVGEHFRLDRLVGAGGYSRVYAAKQLSIGREVAVKVLNATLVAQDKQFQRFFREARAVSSVKGPHVVRVIDFGVDDETHTPFIAMELIEGPNLQTAIEESVHLTQARAAHILRQVALALAEIHNAGVIHRDLKPANILLQKLSTDPDHVKVTDFGIAKIISGHADSKAKLTKTGIVMGTPSYMAPEQGCDGPLGPATDLYALGCILHELLTGTPPFDSDEPSSDEWASDIAAKHCTEPVPPLPDPLPCGEALLPELARLHDELLEKKPEKRPQDAAATAELLALVGREREPHRVDASSDSTTGEEEDTLPGDEEEEPRGPAEEGEPVAAPVTPAAGLLIDWPSSGGSQRAWRRETSGRGRGLGAGTVALLLGVAGGLLFFTTMMWSQCGDDAPEQGGAAVAEREQVGAAAHELEERSAPATSSGASELPPVGADAKPPGAAADTGAPTNIDWLRVRGGQFRMGTVGRDRDERPPHLVILKAFSIARTETTVAQYRACVDAERCKEPSLTPEKCNWQHGDRDDHPINCVDWPRARAFCEWAGGRLPTEAEWEYAARSGGKDQEYPWGTEEPTCERAIMHDGSGKGCGKGRPWPVCSRTAGNTEQGLCDMAGNAWEWVSDWYDAEYYASSPPRDPPGPQSGSRRILRGGSSQSAAVFLRAANRNPKRPNRASSYYGFRCARSKP